MAQKNRQAILNDIDDAIKEASKTVVKYGILISTLSTILKTAVKSKLFVLESNFNWIEEECVWQECKGQKLSVKDFQISKHYLNGLKTAMKSM